ncbi:uncharacterized protein MYCFIDRAFT_195099 [Pseudocercospora fijiensis CIRAD86]|uniref:MARVEL domain-containing protein n=1 Tax=Pseudocercospora fijiensis (strain CIRAD86) TaxID=383855 RepID=M3B3E7_PSEFD|nr:uncharacterized protein MYCFIDRAFT_195099 [Pseudocercospora fijiensis CIRAD86]EME83897.1 hypothetical protein MYCFIDRAFT_195099 [Pseudocercospora fijiensis CIRAD86]
MALGSWQSKQTTASWQDTARPITFLLVILCATIIALIVTIAVNVTVANAPDNDLGYGFGWVLMMPVPAIAFVWTIIDILVCRFWNLHSIYSLVSAILLAIGYVIVGVFTALFYNWNDEGAWVPSIFFFINAIIHTIFMGFAARAIHINDKNEKAKKLDVRMSDLQKA